MLIHMLLSLMAPAHADEPTDANTTPHSEFSLVIGPTYNNLLFDGGPTCNELSAVLSQTTNTTALCGEAATKDSIMRALIALSDQVEAHQSLTVYYTGLGYTSDAGNPALLPADFYAHDLRGTSLELHRDLSGALALIQGDVTIVIDAVHSHQITWELQGGGTDGRMTQGPWAQSFDGIGKEVRVISATDGEYASHPDLFGNLLVAGLSGDADENDDLIITFGELETHLITGIANGTGDTQSVTTHGDWLTVRNRKLMAIPPPPEPVRTPLDLTKVGRVTWITGGGIAAASCTTALVGRGRSLGAHSDLVDGNYNDRTGYDDLVGQFQNNWQVWTIGATVCGGGLAVAAVGGTLELTGRVGNKPTAQLTLAPVLVPRTYGIGFHITW